MVAKGKWTGALVRQWLPRVQVKLLGRVHKGSVSGRRNKFATVWLQQGGHVYEARYSWAAVTRALNKGTALRVS